MATDGYVQKLEADLLGFAGRIDALKLERLQDFKEIASLRAENERMKQALVKIASYGEGDTVRGHFDEPASAKIAREALEATGQKLQTEEENGKA